ncbi:MAG: tyrosine-type recombinase/integrase [Streptosporangiales bacterium]
MPQRQPDHVPHREGEAARGERGGGDRGTGGEATPHVLRHTFGSRLLNGGTEIARVAELMGHKRLETTRRYAASSPA